MSALLIAAAGKGLAYGQAGGDERATLPSPLRGQVSSVQMDADGNPEWIQSGIWVMRLSPTDDPDMPEVNLVSRIAMVMLNGSAMHTHRIFNFELSNYAVNGNGTVHTFEGTATVTMREGPVADVPLVIEIANNSVIAMSIGPDRVDSHFGTGPVYGTLSERSQNATKAATGRDMAHGTSPANNTSVQLEGLTRESVQYHSNSTGYLVYPEDGAGSRLPAVVMVHEWWGLNQNIKNMAETLAKEGYVVLAVDLYGEVATEPGRAQELAGSVRNNQQAAIDNLNGAVAHLSSLSTVNSSKIATLGWCFGGGQTMQHALSAQQPLAATVIYYGNLVTDEQQVAKIKWPVMGVFGSEDQSIPVATVDEFRAALDANNITNEVYVYEGVGHAFANPSGDNYAPDETKDAWEKTLDFLGRHVRAA
ncbi:MAG: dienelactone hydrolase family protein [Nitrososphaera sp.]|uniref:dienelactone hydrolase family protein n=1 Tax=Nitrososphaera sp. TaxID=1971748 RepID=UPI003D6FEDFD